jgi:hypothetical protein
MMNTLLAGVLTEIQIQFRDLTVFFLKNFLSSDWVELSDHGNVAENNTACGF